LFSFAISFVALGYLGLQPAAPGYECGARFLRDLLRVLPIGQRVRKTTSGVSTYFVYDDAGHLVGEYSNSGALIAETIWLGDTPVAVLKPNGSGGVNVFYIHSDHLNTPRRISRPSDNAIVWRWDSDPFGATAANQDPDGDSTAFVYNLRFPGQYYDSETGLNYNYFRDYDPATGRYVESDPIGLLGGISTYGYVNASPLSAVDPLGLRAVYKWPPNNYGDVPPPGAACQEAIFSGGILMGWMPCGGDSACGDGQALPGASDYGYDGWPTFPSNASPPDPVFQWAERLGLFRGGSSGINWSATWMIPRLGLMGVSTASYGSSGDVALYLGVGRGVGKDSIAPSWQNSINLGDPTGLGIRGSASLPAFAGSNSWSAFISPTGVNMSTSVGPGSGGSANVTIGYRYVGRP
jgi:RHS repeat-associated protein